MKSVTAMMGAGIILLMLGAILGALNSFRGVDFTEPHIEATGGGVTTVTITLANDVLDNHTTNISVSSDNVLDAPVPYSYTSSTHHLVINGLAESDSRTLTIVYKVPQLDDFLDLAARFMPMFLILGVMGVVAGAVVQAFRHD